MYLHSSLRLVCLPFVAWATGVAFLESCAPPGAVEQPPNPTESSNEQRALPAGDDEQVVREALEELSRPELPPRDVERAKRLFRSVESLGYAKGRSSLELLFTLLLASRDELHLQRAALFSLVRRAPASLDWARKLLEPGLPEVSRRVNFVPGLSGGQQRSYERGLAAAVLGASGLVTAREPLRTALGKTDDFSELALFAVALARLERHDEQPEPLKDALATVPKDAEVARPLAWGLTQLVPTVEALLLPCSFEVMRLGAPPLVVEVLAASAEDRTDEQLAPRLLELAERVEGPNPQAADHLMLAAATLAGPELFDVVAERLLHRRSAHATWVESWVEDMARAYSTCRDDLDCHSRLLGERETKVAPYKSAQFVAARTASDQGLAVLARMEEMPRPDWLAVALDQRLLHPSRDEVIRVEKLARERSGSSSLYAPSSDCARLDSPLEELAIRLEVRRKMGQ